MLHEFKKHFIDSKGDYKIEYWYNGNYQKVVNKNQPLYLQWLAKKNVPKEIVYVAPSEPTREQLLARADLKAENNKKAEYRELNWIDSTEYTDLQIELLNIDKMSVEQLKEYLKD